MKRLEQFPERMYPLIKECCEIFDWFTSYITTYSIRRLVEKKKIINNEIIILGNGPSINETNFLSKKFSRFDFLCVNFFGLDKERFFALKPKYYCIVDPAFFSKDNTKDTKRIRKLYNIFEKVEWEMHIVIFCIDKIKIRNKNIKILNLNRNIYDGNNSIIMNYLFRKKMACIACSTVIQTCLYFAITYKAKAIYLYGVENDWHREIYVNKNNEVIRKFRHFYGNEELNLTKDKKLKKGELDICFYSLYIDLHIYKKLKLYADYMEIPVYNCVENSYIDVFKKTNI